MTTVIDECPNCEGVGLFWAYSFCPRCGWHAPGTTTDHENFAPQAYCRWCHPLILSSENT